MRDESQPLSFSGFSLEEKWVSGTYIISGLFSISGDGFDPETLTRNLPTLFSHLQQCRRWKLPRGICGYFAIPIYCSEKFSSSLIHWVQNRPKYRYAMWHEPVLYDLSHNEAYTSSFGAQSGAAFRSFVVNRQCSALAEIAKNMGIDSYPSVNGTFIEGFR